MNPIKFSKDKYGRKLAIIGVSEAVPINEDLANSYIAVLVVYASNGNARNGLNCIARKLAEQRAFIIAVFITDQYDWTFDNALMFGIDAWFTVSSKEAADDFVSCLREATDINGFPNLDLADIKTILYHGDGQNAYYACGISKFGNVKEAIDEAVKNATDKESSIYEYNKVLLAVFCSYDLSRNQIKDINDFTNSLSEKHKDKFQFKWGLTQSALLSENTLKVCIIASR